MEPDDVVRLPAGWYPDPTGLPQLRWWDNHAWTQHTTAARQPLIVQESRLAWADDLPTRRERRERERVDRGGTDAALPTDESLRELDPPNEDAEPFDEPAPENTLRYEGVPNRAGRGGTARDNAVPGAVPDKELPDEPQPVRTPPDKTLPDEPAPQEHARFAGIPTDDDDNGAPWPGAARRADAGAAFEPRSATGHTGRIPSVPPLDTDPGAAAGAAFGTVGAPAPGPAFSVPTTEPGRASGPATVGTPLFDQVAFDSRAGASGGTAAMLPAQPPFAAPNGNGMLPAATSTAPVWIIALFPLLQLVIVLLLVTGFGATVQLNLVIPILLGVIYLTMIALSFGDYRILKRSGITTPAHWTWSLLTSPVYLFVRATVLTRKTGRGFGPVLVWFALALLSVASVVAVPGMLITAVPAAFSAQAEQSVAADAAANGANLEVHCPPAPPILIGQAFSCTGTAGPGKSYEIEVSLQRSNGWIDWRVDDWGINTLSR